MPRLLFSLSVAAALVVAPLDASAFTVVEEKDRFVDLVDGKALTRFGIRLEVTPDGQINGRGFGRDVRGAWNWQQGYFCRSLYWGSRDLGQNCQEVRVSGETLRFTSDLGQGDFADLKLR